MNNLNKLIIELILEFVSYCKFNSNDKDYKKLNKLYYGLNNDYHNRYNYNDFYEYMNNRRGGVIFINDNQISIFKNGFIIYIDKPYYTIRFNLDNPYCNIMMNKLKKIIELIELENEKNKKINQCIAICKTLQKNEFKRPFDLTEDIMNCY